MRQNNSLHYAKHMCDQTLSHPKTFPRYGKFQKLTHNSPSQERFLPEPCLHSTRGCTNADPILAADSISLLHKGIYPRYSQANKGENKTWLFQSEYLPQVFSCKIRDNIINAGNGWIWKTDSSTDSLCRWSLISIVDYLSPKCLSVNEWLTEDRSSLQSQVSVFTMARFW